MVFILHRPVLYCFLSHPPIFSTLGICNFLTLKRDLMYQMGTNLQHYIYNIIDSYISGTAHRRSRDTTICAILWNDAVLFRHINLYSGCQMAPFAS